MTRFELIPSHIEMATAATEASTPQAPFTPHIQAAPTSVSRPTSRIPSGKQQPSINDSGAVNSSTTTVRPLSGSEMPVRIAIGRSNNLETDRRRDRQRQPARRAAIAQRNPSLTMKLPMPVNRIIDIRITASV